MDTAQGRTGLDLIATDLQELRARAGHPSYAEIVTRIGQQRRDRGEPDASRPGRTTVYDAFRLGRRRLDSALVLEIVRALGAGDDEVEAWAERCRRARDDGAQGARGVASVVSAPSAFDPRARPVVAGRGAVAVTLACCVLVNLLGRTVVDVLHLPLFLDMVGTAVSSVVLGPWWGALVGVVTNVAGVASSGPGSVPFALVNVAGALVWGYGWRRGWGRSVPRFLLLNLAVGAVCTAVAVPILLLLFDGFNHHAEDRITATVLSLSHVLWLAVLTSNLLTSIADKVVTGFVALAVVESLPGRGTSRWAERTAGASGAMS
ncbi:MAG: ECF transporter S component [Nocardioides sp.]